MGRLLGHADKMLNDTPRRGWMVFATSSDTNADLERESRRRAGYRTIGLGK